MEPLTINFEGLSEFAAQLGPYGHLVGHAMVMMFFGIICWRSAAKAGRCHAENDAESEQAYIAKSIMSGVVGLFGFIMVMVISGNLFATSLAKANSVAESRSALAGGIRSGMIGNVEVLITPSWEHSYQMEGSDAKAVVISTKRPLSMENQRNNPSMKK